MYICLILNFKAGCVFGIIMTSKILSQNKNGTFCGMVSQSVNIITNTATLWKTVGNYTGLAEWVVDVKDTESLSKIKNDIGAARKITFADGSNVIEYAIGWQDRERLSYIATSGLPLSAYHATISVYPKGKACQVNWTSFLLSQDSNKKQFLEFLEFMEGFYAKSLEQLKAKVEKTT
ncbi:MAG: SRPBCC family protein [Nitrosopumilaceae archaeon]|nr:SRPBCC family protein [Nitrosopumilaceae archaeon]